MPLTAQQHQGLYGEGFLFAMASAAGLLASRPSIDVDGIDWLSANLCEALVGLGGRAGHPFEMSVSLAASRGYSSPLTPVRFRRDHLPVLKEAADELRARTPEEDVVVTGEVVRLHREGHGSGEITLVGRVDDLEPLRRIWLDLPSDEYEEAMRAHRRMREVTVRGSLVRRGTRFYLAQPTGFRLLNKSEPE